MYGNALKTSGDAVFPAVIAAVFMYVCAVGGTYFFGIHMGLCAIGAYIGLAMDECVRAIGMYLDGRVEMEKDVISYKTSGVIIWKMSVNGKDYEILKLLGHGKGGYSYLATDGSRNYVLKQIHHEPCSYYTFGNKIEAENDRMEEKYFHR